MKIISNISYQNTTLNKSNQKNNRVKTLSTPQLAQDTVSFKGIGKLDPRNLKRLDGYVREMISYSSGILGLDKEVVNSAVKRSSKPQRNFFAILTDKFNRDNFYRPAAEKDDPNIVLSLVDKIQFPTASHFRFADTRRFGIPEVAECMERLDFNPVKIRKFHAISRDLGKNTNASSQDIVSILRSENGLEYIKKYSTYEPYFKRHLTEPDAVKKLDEMVSNGTYDAVKERKIFEIERKTKDLLMSDVVDVKRLAPYSSEESNNMLGIFNSKLNPSRLKDKTNYSENLAEIYSTTTKENFEARAAYMDTYLHVQGVHEYGKNEMDNITKLFRRMDEDPSVMSFVKKVSVPESNTVGAGGFLRILDAVTPEKRALYTDNIREIMSNGTRKPVNKVIKFCGMQPDTVTGKIKKGITSSLKSFVDSIKGKDEKRYRGSYYKRIEVAQEDKPEIIPVKSIVRNKNSAQPKSNLPAIRYSFPALDLTRPRYTAPVLPKLADIVGGSNGIKFNIPVSVVKKSSEVVAETVEKEPKVIKRGVFVNRTSKQPSAQKLQVISDVNNLIEKKLGKNTLADQSRSYERGATKMRLGMLPEIFESIKETRAQKRLAGTFSKHKSESNADALTLYNLINGKNKRLVNYMLKVRNEDGTRVYSVKDIISTVGETEKSIRMAKLRGTPIPPAEAKAMYSTLIDEQVAQHGKLPRAKKK